MKSLTWIAGVVLILLMAGCATKMYGVPKEQWDAMTKQERISAMEAYRAKQELTRQQQEEQARLRAMEKEAQLAREAEEARLRQQRIDAIYRGQGRYGDLLRVRLEGGRLKFRNDHKPYHALAFQVAAGEVKEIEAVSQDGQRARMVVSYDGSNLLLDDTPGSSRSYAVRIPYEEAWKAGATYPALKAEGPLQIRGVQATVQIVGPPPAVKPVPPKPMRPEPIVVSQPPPRIKVFFRKGDLRIQKGRYPMVSQAIDLREGQVRAVTLHSRQGDLKIRVSYLEGEVHIDDAPGGRGENSIRLGFVPGWHAGQRYVFEHSGNRFLENLEVFIQSVRPAH